MRKSVGRSEAPTEIAPSRSFGMRNRSAAEAHALILRIIHSPKCPIASGAIRESLQNDAKIYDGRFES
jgi:hypothetical protein